MSLDFLSVLKRAKNLRESNHWFDHTEAFRLFHGPGEVSETHPSHHWALDVYGSYLWWTVWQPGKKPSEEVIRAVQSYVLESFGVHSAYGIVRPIGGIPDEPVLLWGSRLLDPMIVSEDDARYEIRMEGERHPGLFLDHRPLRNFLRKNLRKKRVLNLFSYTGSLSIASAQSGADFVLSIDLSKKYTDWAKKNAEINGLATRMDFIYGDVFEWLPRIAKKIERNEIEPFDTVIIDPPSFSRSKDGSVFSTEKDTVRLHKLCLPLLSNRALLISSINSVKIKRSQFVSEVTCAVSSHFRAKLISEIHQDPTFPSDPKRPESTAYLKGVILELNRK
jgi:23S rRNA G2069 N7-methylase RlmK/C1962 C5-methylase RlmI